MKDSNEKALGQRKSSHLKPAAEEIVRKQEKKSNWRNLAAHNTYIFASNFNFNLIQL